MTTTKKIQIEQIHPGQEKVHREKKRFNVLECGRRFGKSTYGRFIAVEAMIEGKKVGWFAATYKILWPEFEEIERILNPIIAFSNKTERRIRLINGGEIEFWSLEDENAGRSRKYHRVVIDEASLSRNLKNAWEQAIRATLTDYRGDAFFLFTPKGQSNFAHQLYTRGVISEGKWKKWKSWNLSSYDNPHLPRDEIDDAKAELPPEAFNQEYMAIPSDDAGNPFGIVAIRRNIRAMSLRDPVCFGVDLAKSKDWTWIIGLDERSDVCVIDRWQGDWSVTKTKLVNYIGGVPALIDATGVGDPIVEELQSKLPNVEGFKFTNTSKQQLMEGLASAFHQNIIGIPFAESSKTAEVLINELELFEYQYKKSASNSSAKVTYSAPQGMTDDGVCALALAKKCHIAMASMRRDIYDWGTVLTSKEFQGNFNDGSERDYQ